MQQGQLPYWVQVIQALGPTIVALVVGTIAALLTFWQFKTARDKLRLELFEKRYAIYQKFEGVLATTLSEGTIGYGEVLTFYRNTRGTEFLFGPEVEAYLNEIREKLNKLAYLEGQIKRGAENNPKYDNNVDESAKMMMYVEEQLTKVLRSKFESYLSLSQMR